MTPAIAITSVPREVPTGYGPDRADTIVQVLVDAVAAAGGVPLLLPVVAPELAPAQLAAADGLLLAGGQDLALDEDGEAADGRWIDPARDRHELALWAAAEQDRMPVLGVCRGLQLINVARGGTLIAHLDGHDAGAEHGERHHAVELTGAGILRGLLPAHVEVNSLHHQAVAEVGRGLSPVAWALDGTIEAAEGRDGDHWLLGVQWHPELMRESVAGQPLFDAFVAAAGRQSAG